ncbi:hypothetical protein Gpo141_00008597 [Globisporangium polare]
MCGTLTRAAATASRLSRWHALRSVAPQRLFSASICVPSANHRSLAVYKGARSFASLADVIPRAILSAPREHRPPPPPLPAPELFHLQRENCSIEYIDIQQPAIAKDTSDGKKATFVLVHGAPGTYNDYRHIIPLLQQQHDKLSVRIIGVNLPGFGGSVVNEKRYFEQISALPAAKLTLQMLQELCAPEENVFLMGHSFGAHAAINIAAFNQNSKQETSNTNKQALNVKGMALLAPAGCRPHRVLRPEQNAVIIDLLRSSIPLVPALLTQAIKLLYTKLLGFSSDFPASHFVAGIVRAGTTDFAVITDHVHATKDTTPALLAWSKSDEYMEEAIPQELAKLCHPMGPRIAFAGGGHNIQKTRADVLAVEVVQWVCNVLNDSDDGSDTKENKGIVEQP